MANGLDKLERLFSTKKKSAPTRHTAEANIYGSVSIVSSAPDPQEHTHSHMHSHLPSHTQLGLPEIPPCFPQSPFIRPKPNVMQPRNELNTSPPTARTTSSRPNSARSYRFNSQPPSLCARSDEMNDRLPSSYSATAFFHIPSRTSSLLSRRHDRIPGGLIQLNLPRETAFADDGIHSALFPDAPSFPRKEEGPSEAAQNGLLDALPIYPASRVETPPPSDQDEFTFPSPPRGRKSATNLPQLQHQPPFQLTPQPSPDMEPQPDSPLNEPKSSTDMQRATASAPSRRATTSHVPLVNDDWRDSYVQDSEDSASSRSSTVFHGYPVEDFLSMTDDDLAEVKVVHPSKPPSKRAPPPPILSPLSRSASVASTMRRPVSVSPALASSQVAAWEAARIAKKYDFDVVYIANFGPSRLNHLHHPRKHMAYSTSTPSSAAPSAPSSFTQSPPASMLSSPASDRPAPTTRSCTPRHSSSSPTTAGSASPPAPAAAAPATIRDCCPHSGTPAGAPRGLSGALLAAYGLETIQAPFRLSSTVHRKILRAEGWIEHRNSAAAANEFARGYARAFHTGGAAPATPAMFRRSSAPDVPPPPSLSSSSPRRTSAAARDGKKIDRGIVFVAYRRPRGPGGAVNSSAAELDALEGEAATLVELILDFHKERRRWETLQEQRRAREGAVGPPS